jgi:hypothetical protein
MSKWSVKIHSVDGGDWRNSQDPLQWFSLDVEADSEAEAKKKGEAEFKLGGDNFDKPIFEIKAYLINPDGTLKV